MILFYFIFWRSTVRKRGDQPNHKSCVLLTTEFRRWTGFESMINNIIKLFSWLRVHSIPNSSDTSGGFHISCFECRVCALTKIIRKIEEKDKKSSPTFSKWEYFCQNWRIIRQFWQKYSHLEKTGEHFPSFSQHFLMIFVSVVHTIKLHNTQNLTELHTCMWIVLYFTLPYYSRYAKQVKKYCMLSHFV